MEEGRKVERGLGREEGRKKRKKRGREKRKEWREERINEGKVGSEGGTKKGGRKNRKE